MTRFLLAPAPAAGRDWSKFFAEIAREGSIPVRKVQEINESRAVFQAMYLDLADVKARIEAAAVTPAQTRIYADVLRLPAGMSWSIKASALTIYAREIICETGARINIDFKTSKSASLLIFTNRLGGLLNIYALDDKGEVEEFPQAAAPAEGGVQILYQDGAPVQVGRSRKQGAAPTLPDEFTGLLQTQFLYGAVLYDQEPDLALSQMTWLKDWGGSTTDLVGLFYRSASLLALLSSEINARSNGAEFVPYLSKDVYESLAKAYVAEVQDFENKYLTLFQVTTLTENDIKMARALLDNQSYKADYVEQLLAQASANYDHAEAAADAAYTRLKKAQDHAALVQIDFEKLGIPEWEREQIVKAVISLGTAVITFAVGIGSMFVGNAAGGAAAAGAAASTAGAVASAAGTAKKTAELAKQIKEAMDAIKKMVEALAKIGALVKAILAAANDIKKAEGMIEKVSGLDVATGDADMTGAAQWQVFELHAQEAIKPALDAGIGYARELSNALKEIVIYGQALTAARAAEIQEGQTLARTMLQKKLAESQQERLKQLVDSLEAGQAPNQEMMEQFYLRYVDSKSSLFSALKGYQAAYRYWALRPSDVQPRIIDPVDKIDSGLKQITSIALDRQEALRRFSPPPQPFKNMVVEITDPKVLEALHETGETSWSVPLDQTQFRGDARVRLTTVRLWLDADYSAPAQVRLKVYSEGNYLDRFQGDSYQFTSKPFERVFEYKVKASGKDGAWRFDNGDEGVVVIDGRVDDEVKYAYFEPTPFGQWRMTLSSGVDPRSVTKISMELEGSLIGELAEKERAHG